MSTSSPPRHRAYFVGTLVLRAIDLHRGISLHLKLDNVSNSEHWDAGREVLYPQPGFRAMLWLSLAL